MIGFIRDRIDPRKWVVILYTSERKDDVLGVYRFDTIRQIAHVVGCKPSHVSNVYHKLVTARDGMQYLDVLKKHD
jgi:hypothetical protein